VQIDTRSAALHFLLVRKPAPMRSGCTVAIRAECADVECQSWQGCKRTLEGPEKLKPRRIYLLSVLTRWDAHQGAGSRNRPRPQSPPRRQLKTIPGGVSIMSWFFIALCAPFLLACANHNDKLLLSRYLKEKNIGSMVISSSLFSGVAIPIVLFIQPDLFDVSLVQGSAVVATGMLSVLAIACYLYALDLDEASFVAPFYQTVPIFAYFLGYFILGETITLAQGLGSFVIIVGSLALSFEFGRRGMRFKRNVVVLMLAASFLSA
jgi:drug/metabolite transporter (DMT)-like permease